MFKRSRLFFFVFVAVSFLLMSYQSRSGGFLDDNIVHTLINHVRGGTSYISEALKAPFRKIAVRDEENRKLRRQVNRLLQEKSGFKEVINENIRLRELLSLREKTDNYVTTARVIARDTSSWARSFTLDKGKSSGIDKNMAAITPRGLAGKTFGISPSYSHLLIVTDINFSASVRIQDSRTEGILSGTGAGRCILKYIPYEEDVHINAVVVTSGLDSLFPPGIPVGTVSRVNGKTTRGHFQSIEVTPFLDEKKLEEVIIVR